MSHQKTNIIIDRDKVINEEDLLPPTYQIVKHEDYGITEDSW
jgi:hypothetical protein